MLGLDLHFMQYAVLKLVFRVSKSSYQLYFLTDHTLLPLESETASLENL